MEAVFLHIFNLKEVGIGQNRVIDTQYLTVASLFL